MAENATEVQVSQQVHADPAQIEQTAEIMGMNSIKYFDLK